MTKLFEEDNSEDTVDFYRIYKEELKHVKPCDEAERKALIEAVLAGDSDAGKRLVEGHLDRAVLLAEQYRDKGLPLSDLVQEANMALLLFVGEYEGGDFLDALDSRMKAAVLAALKSQDTEARIEEEMAARVNVLSDIAAGMANELGREATVEELAERMKMTVDEIKDIMKLTLDAVTVSGEA